MSPPGCATSSISISGTGGMTTPAAVSPPRIRGATKASTSSVMPLANRLRNTPAPPSTSRFVSRRRPSSWSSSRSRSTGSRLAACQTSQPAARRAAIRSGGAPGAAATRTGDSWLVRTRFAASGRRHWLSSTIRSGCRGPAGRGVSSGSSASAVPMPTAIASTRPRRAWTIPREAGDEIQRSAGSAPASRPSRLIAHLAMTHGRPCSTSVR